MKCKVSNYISRFFVEHGVDTVFSVTGGGAMHLNDAFGHQEGLKCIYNHHEQASAIAAEAYARVAGKMAVCCVTSGPGGTNAITGVVGGWLDSIPMFIISGQVRYDTTARSTGLNIRAMGDQEFDITKAVGCMTKYSEMVINPQNIRYCLEKAFAAAQVGRPGPVWLDIPLDVQGAFIETDELTGFDGDFSDEIPNSVQDSILDMVIEKIKSAQRPVINVGSGVRAAGGIDEFNALIETLGIPVVTGWNSIDCVCDSNPLYVGRAGIMGDRAGNFAVQNSDLLLSIGSRLSIRQVGYNFSSFARAAYKIVVDIDGEELKKKTVNPDLPVCADAKDFCLRLTERFKGEKPFSNFEWLNSCREWKKRYPVVQQKHREPGKANVYNFIKTLSDSLDEGRVTVVGNGSACVVGSHAYTIKSNQRFIINSAIASMGYDLPAAIGACVAKKDTVICVTGDGSIQMNLQELQTIISNSFPIRIFIINNSGYHSIRQTQLNYFGKPLVGIGPESGDLTFPDMSKIAAAYGYEYIACSRNEKISEFVEKALSACAPLICEVFVSEDQPFEPKSTGKKLEDGTIVSPPLEDLSPHLDRKELEDNMYIPLID